MLERWQARFGLPPSIVLKNKEILAKGEQKEMKNQKVSIAEASAYPFAVERFIQTCGFNLETEKLKAHF